MSLNFLDDIFEDSQSGGSERNILVKLSKAWGNEAFAPDILDYQSTLIKDAREKLETQQNIVDDLRNGAENKSFYMYLYLAEIERGKYLLRSYLLVRLRKIEKYGLHFLMEQKYRERLSPEERRFAERYHLHSQALYTDTCLGELPEQVRDILDPSMIMQPDLNSYVFIRALEDIGYYRLEDRTVEAVEIVKNDIYLIRYASISKLLEEKKVELV